MTNMLFNVYVKAFTFGCGALMLLDSSYFFTNNQFFHAFCCLGVAGFILDCWLRDCVLDAFVNTIAEIQQVEEEPEEK